MMNILMIGDVIGDPGCEAVRKLLPGIKKQYSVDLVVVNAENSAKGNGVNPTSALHLQTSGCDILTGGNHTLYKTNVYSMLENSPFVLRPANLPRCCPGKGWTMIDMGPFCIAVVNLIGQVFMGASNSPFEAADQILKQIDTPNVLVDFHAEATGEKGALARYLDGRVSAIVGTHTHVQTADACILPKGSGFITDVGMTGPINSILGINADFVIKKMTTHSPVTFEVASGPCCMHAVLIGIDPKTGRCESMQAIAVET